MFTIILDNILTFSSIIVSLVALIFVILVPRRILTNQIFFDLVKEYSSTEFNYALQQLWDIYNSINFNNSTIINERINIASTIIIPKYIKDYENSKNTDYYNISTTLHNSRRIVSHFFQKLAFLKFYGLPKLSKRRLRKYFDVSNFKLIELLIPIEIIALPYLSNNAIPNHIHNKDKYLYKLLVKSYKWSKFWKKYRIGYLKKEKYFKYTNFNIEEKYSELIEK